MSSPLESTRNVDVDAVPEQTVQDSRLPAGAARSPLPGVGTNEVSEWAMWDPNLWWTDWALPPDPRPSWEQWFEWVNQLKALTPALGEASQDWQTMAGQFEDSLASVRTMRADLATWSGPSAQTMSDSLDRLEESITTKSAAIRENPRRLQDLAQAINDAVPPMAALDAEYQQVLQDLNACRQVAERGRPIMLNLATRLLQTGTDLENSVRTDNLAPQPVPPQALALSSGPQGPTDALTQVAGSSPVAGVSPISTAAPIATADLPGVAPAGDLTGVPGIQAAQGAASAPLPGVAVDPTVAPGTVPDPTTATASPTLAGASVAPTAAAAPPIAAPVAATPAPVLGGAMPPAASFMPPAVLAAGAGPSERNGEKDAAVVVATPMPTGTPVTAAAAVPAGLLGRTQSPSVKVSVTVRTGKAKAKKKPDQDTAQK